MGYVINQSDFFKAFRLDKATHYEMFNEKLDKKLAEILHPSAVVDNLDLSHLGRMPEEIYTQGFKGR
ncbi:MAG: hypothetical protein H0U23_15470 [Blastocatellia bacterium]|nr:hypothetical protein [Blastocatellia bacterium]